MFRHLKGRTRKRRCVTDPADTQSRQASVKGQTLTPGLLAGFLMDECHCLLREAHRQRRELAVVERRGRVHMAQTQRPRKAVAGDVTTCCLKLWLAT